MEKPGSCSVLILPEARVRCKTSPAAILNLREKMYRTVNREGSFPGSWKPKQSFYSVTIYVGQGLKRKKRGVYFPKLAKGRALLMETTSDKLPQFWSSQNVDKESVLKRMDQRPRTGQFLHLLCPPHFSRESILLKQGGKGLGREDGGP